MPIDEDMFFPVRDCQPEQELIAGSELRVVNDVLGHLGLFGVSPDYRPQIDRHLGELLGTGLTLPARSMGGPFTAGRTGAGS